MSKIELISAKFIKNYRIVDFLLKTNICIAKNILKLYTFLIIIIIKTCNFKKHKT